MRVSCSHEAGVKVSHSSVEAFPWGHSLAQHQCLGKFSDLAKVFDAPNNLPVLMTGVGQGVRVVACRTEDVRVRRSLCRAMPASESPISGRVQGGAAHLRSSGFMVCKVSASFYSPCLCIYG